MQAYRPALNIANVHIPIRMVTPRIGNLTIGPANANRLPQQPPQLQHLLRQLLLLLLPNRLQNLWPLVDIRLAVQCLAIIIAATSLHSRQQLRTRSPTSNNTARAITVAIALHGTQGLGNNDSQRRMPHLLLNQSTKDRGRKWVEPHFRHRFQLAATR